MAELPKPEPAPDTALARVLALEARLDQLLADAAVEAREIVRAADERARARMAELDRELARVREEVEAELEEARARAVAELQAGAGRKLEGYRAVDQARVEELAEWVARQVLLPEQGDG
jgi:F0F1-type ATP synthase membrane subunit b/b'